MLCVCAWCGFVVALLIVCVCKQLMLAHNEWSASAHWANNQSSSSSSVNPIALPLPLLWTICAALGARIVCSLFVFIIRTQQEAFAINLSLFSLLLPSNHTFIFASNEKTHTHTHEIEKRDFLSLSLTFVFARSFVGSHTQTRLVVVVNFCVRLLSLNFYLAAYLAPTWSLPENHNQLPGAHLN